jgi:hypothetical protein
MLRGPSKLELYFSLENLDRLSCYVCDIGNAFLYGKIKEKVYVTAVS